MAIPSLTDEQVHALSREEKDRWWLTNVFRGDMPQLTLRSALTGFFLGGILSATNLYIGAKTGWTLGVGLTAVILAFASFRLLASLGARDMTILENNCSQSIATAAGYMTGPLISGMAAYMMVQNVVMSFWQMMIFNVVLSILGVLVAFPMKRRFINDEQQPFPEGRAAGVVLDTLYTSHASVGIFKAKVLLVAALLAAGIRIISAESINVWLQTKILGLKTAYWLSEYFDHWAYWLIGVFTNRNADEVDHVKIADIPAEQLALRPGIELAMFGAGGLMGPRPAINMMLGMLLCYAILVPTFIHTGDIADKSGNFMNAAGQMVNAAGDLLPNVAPNFNQRDILAKWPLWPGVVIIVLASLIAFFAKPKVIISAFTGLFDRKKSGDQDCLKDIEFPLWISLVGIPIVGAVGVILAHAWFGVAYHFGALAIALTILLTLIAVNATALTSITPTGALSKITQLTFGVSNPGHPPTNLMTACMTTEVASNAANLLMDIKPGYMLGAKPRQQAWGHCIGILSGALASTPLFYIMFLAGHPDNPITPVDPRNAGVPVYEMMTSPDHAGFAFTAAVQWKGINDLISHGWSGMPQSAQYAMIFGALFTVIFELLRIFTKNKSPISPIAFGLGFVLPPDSTISMFFGATFFWAAHVLFGKRKESLNHRLWVDTREPICAGLIAGWSLLGIFDALVKGFFL
ncbi:MAG TPA: OPT/YSL family transporter [Phycisphaerales bacterium]|nr:OPT/YSL family transporter [Phycisphaerales bacterium]